LNSEPLTIMTTIQSLPLRLGLLAAILAVIGFCGWFAAKAIISDRLVFFSQQQNEYDTATNLLTTDKAASIAATNPNIHYQRGLTYFAQANGEDTELRLREAIASFTRAAELSPEDFRVQVALGEAFSRQGTSAEAEKSFQKALSIAPNYYEPHWKYGNHLLRAGNNDAAFAEFKRALAIRPSELPLLFDYAWNTYNEDLPTILKVLSPASEAKPQLAATLVEKGKVAEAMTLWRELMTASPRIARINARNFMNSLLAKQGYKEALEVWQSAAKTPNPTPNLPEEILKEDAIIYTVNTPDQGSLLNNGGFENEMLTRVTPPFLAWKLTTTNGLQISRSTDLPKSGKSSLRLSFDVPGNATFSVLEQALAVKPSTSYKLKFAAKTEELTTLSAPLIEVYDPADIKRLRAALPPLPLKTNPWQEYSLNFTTSSATEAVILRVFRPACGEPPCPILGKIWLDDFRLE
jgi:tetratricopeptide (TPR) repeat protein